MLMQWVSEGVQRRGCVLSLMMISSKDRVQTTRCGGISGNRRDSTITGNRGVGIGGDSGLRWYA